MDTDVRSSLRSLLLVDDHAVVRDGLKHLLAPMDSELLITEAATGFEALDCMRRQPFDMAIVDLSMPGMSGLELIRRIKLEFPLVAILVLSMQAESQYAVRAFKTGAAGYVTKDSASAELVAAVRRLMSGGTYMAPHMAEQMVRQLNDARNLPGHALLTDRELEVLRRFVAGERPTEIAHALHVSIKTVSSHKTRIQEKLQLTSMAAMIRYGLENQLD